MSTEDFMRIMRARNAQEEDPLDHWAHDELCMALNYGNCFMEGKHERTTDEDWIIFCDTVLKEYSEECCVNLWNRLTDEQKQLWFSLVEQ